MRPAACVASYSRQAPLGLCHITLRVPWESCRNHSDTPEAYRTIRYLSTAQLIAAYAISYRTTYSTVATAQYRITTRYRTEKAALSTTAQKHYIRIGGWTTGIAWHRRRRMQPGIKHQKTHSCIGQYRPTYSALKKLTQTIWNRLCQYRTSITQTINFILSSPTLSVPHIIEYSARSTAHHTARSMAVPQIAQLEPR
eukprot:3941596-Rhodomonas_salina.1